MDVYGFFYRFPELPGVVYFRLSDDRSGSEPLFDREPAAVVQELADRLGVSEVDARYV
jgi:hypothetical protein